jgi:hypothetical protein
VTAEIDEWFEKKFLEWQSKEGRRKPLSEFAKWLGISRNTLNNYMLKGQKPTGENLEAIASKLGPEIYDVLEMPRPDPRLQAIMAEWKNLPEEEKNKVKRIAERSKNKRN